MCRGRSRRSYFRPIGFKLLRINIERCLLIVTSNGKLHTFTGTFYTAATSNCCPGNIDVPRIDIVPFTFGDSCFLSSETSFDKARGSADSASCRPYPFSNPSHPSSNNFHWCASKSGNDAARSSSESTGSPPSASNVSRSKQKLQLNFPTLAIKRNR